MYSSEAMTIFPFPRPSFFPSNNNTIMADHEGNVMIPSKGSTTQHHVHTSTRQHQDDGPTTEDSSRDSTDDQPVTDAEKRKLSRDETGTGTNSSDNDNSNDGSNRIKKQKIGEASQAGGKLLKNIAPISIKLGSQKPKDPPPTLLKKSTTVANVFNQDSDEEEEMPPEARMRMRNIGRDTPTSAGPNSFGKTRQGFCDMKKVFEKQLKKQMEDISKK